MNMKKNTGIAIVPGSFDPITNGHVDIIKRAAETYDSVVVAVMINSNKSYMFSIEERTQIASAAVSDIEGVRVISSKGMLWELAKELGAIAIVKGVRNKKDLEYEREMAEYNSARYPKAETLLLQADNTLTDLSSTLVREMIEKGQPLCGIVPEKAIEEINKIIDTRL